MIMVIAWLLLLITFIIIFITVINYYTLYKKLSFNLFFYYK